MLSPSKGIIVGSHCRVFSVKTVSRLSPVICHAGQAFARSDFCDRHEGVGGSPVLQKTTLLDSLRENLPMRMPDIRYYAILATQSPREGGRDHFVRKKENHAALCTRPTSP